MIAGIFDDVLQASDIGIPWARFVGCNCSGIAQESKEMFVVVEVRNIVTGH